MWSNVEELLLNVNRREEEIEKYLPWFYNHVKCFHHVKEDSVKEIVRRGGLSHVKSSHVVIRQGDVGDRCYIILRGSVSVYAKRLDDVDYNVYDEPTSRITVVKHHKDRARFGVEVSVLKQGEKFGDLCFYNAKHERNATVISDDNITLFSIDKETFRTLLSDKYEDMKDQLLFMDTSQLFKAFPNDFRVTLLEKFKAKRFPFGSVVVRQGDPLTSMYIICRGQAMLKTNPQNLHAQYQLPAVSENKEITSKPLTPIQKRRRILKHGYNVREELLKQKNMTVCTIGVNEVIGDIEFALGWQTHHVSAICYSALLVMEIEVVELHKLILRRDAGIADVINDTVMNKLAARAERCIKIPQYRLIHDFAVRAMDRKTSMTSRIKAEQTRRPTLAGVAHAVKTAAATPAKTREEQRASLTPNTTRNSIATAFEAIAAKRLSKQEEPVGVTPQEDVAIQGTRAAKTKEKPRKEAQPQQQQQQDKGKQFTVKEYRALKKKMQAAGKTIRPLD